MAGRTFPSFSGDSEEGCDEENREVGAHVLDDYPTFEEWIRQFDMDTDIPDMKKLEPAPFPASPGLGRRQRVLRRRKTVEETKKIICWTQTMT